VLKPKRSPAVVTPATLAGPGPIGTPVYAVGHPLGLTFSLSGGLISALGRDLETGRQADRPHPVRRGGQPGQLRRPAAQPGRPGRRYRDRTRQPEQAALLRRHRLRRAHRRRRRRPPRRRCDPSKEPHVDAIDRDPPRHRPRRPGEHPLEQTLYEVKKTIVGQDELLERMIVALLARGHLLVEGVPGLAKTLAIKASPRRSAVDFKRIQFTPDLVPADLIGTRIYNQQSGEFQVSLGPVFANLVLADEINRAPAKVQSALAGGHAGAPGDHRPRDLPAPDPFLVMATQNPIESEGTYPLPEAQVDRFMLKVLVGYPSPAEEFVVVERMLGLGERARPCSTRTQLRDLQRAADAVYVDPGIIQYAVTLTGATRDPGLVGLHRSRALHHLRREPARLDQYGLAGGPWPICADAPMPCPRTPAISRSTSCGTGSCCRTRPWPTMSTPTTSSRPILAAVRMPEIKVGPPAGQVSWHRPSP
jgi:MoxR-like ATPase